MCGFFFQTAAVLTMMTVADPEPIGFVLEVNGAWEVVADPPRRIRNGDRIFPGTSIRKVDSVPGARTDSVSVCFYNGQTEVYKDEAAMPGSRDAKPASRLWTAVFGHYRHGYSSAISRGDDQLIDAVVGLQDGSADFSPALANLDSGSYSVELRQSERKKSPESGGGEWVFLKQPIRTLPFTKEEKPGQAQTLRIDNLNPGLVELTLRSAKEDGQKETIVGTAWVLVCDQENVQRYSDDYAEALKLTASWAGNNEGEEKVPDSAKTAFLRSYLISQLEEQSR